MSENGISSSDRRVFTKQRREAAKQAQKYHREQEKMEKRARKSSEEAERAQKPRKPKKRAEKPKTAPETRPQSKIEEAVNSGRTGKFQKISREEKFIRESDKKIRNLKPKDFEDGYYIDEYSEKKKRDKRAKIIRKQESEVIRRNKKPMTNRQIRLRRIIITASIFLVVLIVGVILSLTVLFKTEKIEVEGDSYYYPEQIIGFSNVEKQQNIFLAKMGATPEEIVKNLAYVEDAKVSFSIPDTITITVTDATPSFVAADAGGYLVLSSKGRILEKTADNSRGLVEVKCGEFSNHEVGDYIEFSDPAIPDILENVADSLRKNEVKDVRAIDVTNTSAITLDYAGRIQINIGVAEDIDYKIKTAMAIITQKLDPNNTGKVYGTLDVSTCSKNKMSHYKPSETLPPTTAPSVPTTTAPPEDQGGDYTDYGAYDGGYIDGNYEWSGDDGSYDGGYDDGSYDGGYDGGYDDGYDNGGYDGGYDDGGYDGGYDYGGYDGGYDGGDNDGGGNDGGGE